MPKLPWLFAILAISSLVGACSDPDAGSDPTSPRSTSGNATDEGTNGDSPSNSNPSSPGTGSPSNPSSPSAPVDAGPSPVGDAGADATAPTTPVAKTAFTGAPDYAAPATTPPNIAKNRHNAATGRNDGNPVGAACLNSGCHGPNSGREFLFGGTVFNAGDATGTPVTVAEVRLVDANGKALSVYSNAQGNFYLPKGANQLTGPVRIGARSAGSTHPMITTPSETAFGNCNACHTGTAQGATTLKVFVK